MVNLGNLGYLLDLRLKVDQLLLRIMWSSPDCCGSELNFDLANRNYLILLHEIITRKAKTSNKKAV